MNLTKQCMSFQRRTKITSTDKILLEDDNRKEYWPKCMHDKDCLVQMMTKGVDGGHHFFEVPRAWVFVITIHSLDIFLFVPPI